MPKDKIIIGIPTYGRGWTLVNPTSDWHIGAATDGASKATPYVKEPGVASYYEVAYYWYYVGTKNINCCKIWKVARTPY